MRKIALRTLLFILPVLLLGCNLTRNFGDYGQYLKPYNPPVYYGYAGYKYDFLFEISWGKYHTVNHVSATRMGGKLEEDLLFRDILAEELLKMQLCPNGYVLEDQGTWGKGPIYSIGGMCK